jgi:flagellar protein FlaG
MDTILAPLANHKVVDMNTGAVSDASVVNANTANTANTSSNNSADTGSQQQSSDMGQAQSRVLSGGGSAGSGGIKTNESDDAIAAVLAEAEQAQANLAKLNTTIEFSVDEATGRDVVTLRDKASQEVVKQFPTEEVLSVLKQISELTGSLLTTEA